MREIAYEDKLKRIINRYGCSAQIDQCIEEMSELAKALLKYKRASGVGQPLAEETSMDDLLGMIAEEIADVQITIDELALGFGLVDEIQDKHIPEKISRTISRIKEDPVKEEEEEIYFEQ